VPAWDRLTGTCTGAYCHGNGIYLSADPIAGTLRTPDWTGSNQAYCGACHGVPPTTHAQSLTLGDCARCHPSVDAQGNPIVDGVTSRHMDGVVDVL
jgi:predicted CxxxxCH...CXXCH cytochrome family protein